MPRGENLKSVQDVRIEVALIYAYLLEKAVFSKLDKKVSQRGAARLLNGKGVLSIRGKSWRLCTIQPFLKRIEFLKSPEGIIKFETIKKKLDALNICLDDLTIDNLTIPIDTILNNHIMKIKNMITYVNNFK